MALSHEAVQRYAAYWGVAFDEAASWAEYVSAYRYFTQAWQVLGENNTLLTVVLLFAVLFNSVGFSYVLIVFSVCQVPRTLLALPGLFIMVSTGQSTARAAALDEEYAATGFVTGLPAWVYFDIWLFPHLALFNFQIATSPGGTRLGSVYDVLNEFEARGIRALYQWEARYSFRLTQGINRNPDGMQGLRVLITQAFSPFWVEGSIGHSWREYRALDLYVRVGSAVEWRPPHAAHYLLKQPIGVSVHPSAATWWDSPVISAYGQHQFDPGYVTWGGELVLHNGARL